MGHKSTAQFRGREVELRKGIWVFSDTKVPIPQLIKKEKK